MISIIIPTLNEEKYLEETISKVKEQQGNDYEIIVVDGGSTDNTIKIAKKYAKVKILNSDKKGRAYQMNLGAEKARGDILLFLHADTLLTKNAFGEIENTLKDKDVVGGGFQRTFSSRNKIMNSKLINSLFFFKLFKVISGDQALFVKKSVFDKVNGYPNIEIMEEFYFCRKLRKYGILKLSEKSVKTSYRRFQQGFIKTNSIFTIMMLFYYLGVNPSKLKLLYKDIR